MSKLFGKGNIESIITDFQWLPDLQSLQEHDEAPILYLLLEWPTCLSQDELDLLQDLLLAFHQTFQI